MSCASLFFEEARKLLLEARDAAAAIHDLLGAAGPGRMRPRIDVEVQLVAFLAPGGAGLVLGAVGHHDRNGMIFRVNFGFHGVSCRRPAPVFKSAMTDFGGSIPHGLRQTKPREPAYLAGFAILRGEAYLVAMKAMS